MFSSLRFSIVARLAVGVGIVGGCLFSPAQDQPADPAAEANPEGPAQLLERGRAAFEAGDFSAAEEALEKFIVDYGEAEEAKEAARIHTPLVAICKVALKKFDEALVWIEKAREDPELDPKLADELAFWRGICLMTQSELVDAQHAFGEYWANEGHQPFKRYEALLMFATLYIQQDFPSEAADFLADQLPKFREIAPEAASRAVVLQLYARIQAGERDKALALIRDEFPNLAEMTQIISFQTLALKLGSSFLDEKEYYKAITCLQRIWPTAKLLEYQNAKIAQIEGRIKVLETRPNTAGTVHQLRAILKRVNRELDGFQRIENFDSALRLRLGMAFQGLERYREAALIMEDILETMPTDSVVESATFAQLQCWMEIGRWPKGVEVAESYEKTFGAEGKYLPTVLFLRAEALREAQDYGAAQLAYGRVVELFPANEFAAKSTFMQGFLYLQQDDNEGALYQFAQLQRNYPDSVLVEDSDYWTGMAYSFSGFYDEARQHLAEYLDRYESPKYRKESIFRIAVCTFSLAEYELALQRLEAFVSGYADDLLADEAHLLIGDAYLAYGQMDEGFAAYEKVRPESGRFFEEAWFKKGNAYKLLEEFETMRQHFQAFVENCPTSGRMPEAVYWVGWTYLNEEKFEEAQKIYWDTVEEHGGDPDMVTITDVFAGLPKVYQQDGEEGGAELLSRLERIKSRAGVAKDGILASRAGWAKSQIVARGNPRAERTELLDIAKWIDPKENSPVISVSVAEALLEGGNILTAKELFTEIRKWYPRAVQKGRIYRALGDIAVEEGDQTKAVEFYEKFEREAITSVYLGEVKLKKADLLNAMGKGADARVEWESVLDMQGVPAGAKAAALYELGESWADDDVHEKAIVFFERVYVAYGKFGELNAKAYWSRGASLEKLDLNREALETYEELVSRPDLKSFEETAKASEKIARLRPLYPKEPEPVEGEGKTGEAES
jgi:tetratricopeptide (TPR) repeat protein